MSSTETDCPCCGATVDALEILNGAHCPNPECRATAEKMFNEAIDDDEGEGLDAECRGLEDEQPDPGEGPTIVYPYEGKARTLE